MKVSRSISKWVKAGIMSCLVLLFCACGGSQPADTATGEEFQPDQPAEAAAPEPAPAPEPAAEPELQPEPEPEAAPEPAPEPEDTRPAVEQLKDAKSALKELLPEIQASKKVV